jgi:hypothetical protein
VQHDAAALLLEVALGLRVFGPDMPRTPSNAHRLRPYRHHPAHLYSHSGSHSRVAAAWCRGHACPVPIDPWDVTAQMAYWAFHQQRRTECGAS